MPQQTADGIPLLPFEQDSAIPDESYEVSEDDIPRMAWEGEDSERFESDEEAVRAIEDQLGAELDEQEVNHDGRTDPAELAAIREEAEQANLPPNERDLGSNEEAEGDPEAEEAEPIAGEPRFEVKVDGETFEVPLSELRNGYSRQQTFTRKTQELAAERRELAEQRLAADELVTTQVAALNALGQVVPEETKTAINQEIRRIQTEYDTRMARHLDTERQRLVSMDARYADPQVLGELADFGRSLGFSDGELGGVHDHRLVKVLDYAHQYIKIKSSGKTIRAKAKSAPKLKPGASGRRLSGETAVRAQTRRAANRLRQTGSPRDAQAVIEGLLAAGDID